MVIHGRVGVCGWVATRARGRFVRGKRCVAWVREGIGNWRNPSLSRPLPASELTPHTDSFRNASRAVRIHPLNGHVWVVDRGGCVWVVLGTCVCGVGGRGLGHPPTAHLTHLPPYPWNCAVPESMIPAPRPLLVGAPEQTVLNTPSAVPPNQTHVFALPVPSRRVCGWVTPDHLLNDRRARALG